MGKLTRAKSTGVVDRRFPCEDLGVSGTTDTVLGRVEYDDRRDTKCTHSSNSYYFRRHTVKSVKTNLFNVTRTDTPEENPNGKTTRALPWLKAPCSLDNKKVDHFLYSSHPEVSSLGHVVFNFLRSDPYMTSVCQLVLK